MTSILFVCLGNICRSVTAEEIFRMKVKKTGREQNFEIDSAGLIDYHEGELADPRMRQHAEAHGYKLTHRSRPVTSSDFSHFDLIMAMDQSNIRALQALASNEDEFGKIKLMSDYLVNHDNSYIPDPYYGEAEDFELVIDLLEDACQTLLESL